MAAFYHCSVLLLCVGVLLASSLPAAAAARDGKSRVQLEELMAADDDFLENWMGKVCVVRCAHVCVGLASVRMRE